MANIIISGSAPSGSGYSLNLTFNVKFERFNQEGNLAYEYNPFHNLRYMGEDTSEHVKGELDDFVTSRLKFSLNNPVNIECQPSYDGSVNLILNDDYGQPKMINSRFTCLENNTYKIIERFKNNNTNIYRDDDTKFNIDTSLYKRINKIPNLTFAGIEPGGINKVGNYIFYFKLADSDGNETDFVAESGIVSCYIGNVNDPFSVRGGIKDESSDKLIKFTLTNIDTAYDYIKVYYTRTYSDIDGVRLLDAFKIDRDFIIRDGVSNITITGYDNQSKITVEDINAQYFVVDKVKAQAQCQNRLFLGNVAKPEIPYKELKDLALRFAPVTYQDSSIGWVNEKYIDSSNGYEYYNPKNIYNKLGYWNGEMYRIGIVFIMTDFSLSPVFNTRGLKGVNASIDNYTKIPLHLNGNRNYIKYDEYNYLISESDNTSNLENVKGVIQINSSTPVINSNSVNPIGLRFMPILAAGETNDDLLNEIKKYAKGFFFVRQKRIPTILAQAITVDLDLNSHLPCIKCPTVNTSYPFIESFINSNRILDHDFEDHVYPVNNYKPEAAICPEAELKIPFFNQLFTGSEFTIDEAQHQPTSLWQQDSSNVRNYYHTTYASNSGNKSFTGVKVILVEDGTKLATSGTQKYSTRAGDAEEAWRVNYISRDTINSNAYNLVRGNFGTFIGVENYNIENRIINIRISNYDYSQIDKYFDIRYQDESPYSAISERYSLIGDTDDITNYICYRGDCFVGNYTHRINRNFQDPEAPTNDVIVDENSWKDNYSVDNKEDNENINRGDVNAVQIGHWVTFKVCANINISLREIDRTNYEEGGLNGRPRAFYPLYNISVGGESKTPESTIINDGLNSTVGDKYNYIMPDVPYLKNEFDNRILYSDIYVNDAFKNGYRVFKSTQFRDYNREYGSIVNLKSFNGNLYCIFEHGVALIPVNERSVAANGDGGAAYINTANVLPENIRVLSSNFGTTWQDSIIMTPNFVYGVDTIAKKIWRVGVDSRFEIISDFKIQQFLNDNITLKEREKTPVIGVRNVKSHYNAYKGDIMFTFYDDLYGFEENSWNICFNEILGKWITFYSWIPSYSANIDNVLFTFDRTTSKWISKLGMNNSNNSYADGVTISNTIIPESPGLVGTLDLVNRNIPNNEAITIIKTFSIEKDNFRNWEHFSILNGNQLYLTKSYITDDPVQLNIKCDITATTESTDPSIVQYLNGWNNYVSINYGYYRNILTLAKQSKISNLTTDFWKHGRAGIIDIQEDIKPCFWYGKQHPFEFEFVVNDNPAVHKIFENLNIISRNCAPESFHFEIVGDVYNFAKDKKNIYYRQEATKELYQNLGSNILFNRNYTKITPSKGITSTLFPLYYERIAPFDEIYDNYQQKQSVFSKDYHNMSGTEVIYNKLLNEYSLVTHLKAIDLQLYGRIRGNMQYKEDIWDVEIRPINYIQKNESDWVVPPIVLNNVPNDLTASDIDNTTLPEKYDVADISLPKYGWTSRKETRIRDKYLRVKVRYSGEDKAIISAIRTLYSISYA